MSLRINHIEMDIVKCLANRDVLQFLVDMIPGNQDGCFRWAIHVIELEIFWRSQRCQFLTTSGEELQRVVLNV